MYFRTLKIQIYPNLQNSMFLLCLQKETAHVLRARNENTEVKV